MSMTAEAVAENKPINRREFLNFAWMVSLGFMTVSLGGVSVIFSMPRFKEGEFGGVINLGRVGDLPTPDAPPVNFPKIKVWLSNTSDGVMAIYKVCTHLGCLYNWNDQETKFICPCHGSVFLPDGTYVRGPAPRSLDRFIVQVEDQEGRILAETDPTTGEPLSLPDDPNAVVKVDTGRRILGPPRNV